MSTYQELVQQRAELDKKIAELQSAARAEAITNARNLITEFGLTADELFKGKKTTRAGSVVAPRYKDPVTGATWTGRGKPPAWIKDKNREDFLIAE